MDVTVILPCAIDDGIENCVASIDADVEVLAVMNGPSPEAITAVGTTGVRSVRIAERNLGKACDVGVREATNDLVLLMNTDCTFAPGAIQQLHDAWKPGTVVRGRVVFVGTSMIARAINDVYQLKVGSPPRAYQPMLLFHRGIADQIGAYYFDHDIHWTEDADFDRRIRAADIGIVHIDDAVAHHRELSLRGALKSAFRYGIGRRIAEEKQLFGTVPHFSLHPGDVFRELRSVRRTESMTAAAYATIWLISFACGHRWQRWTDVYGTRRKLPGAPDCNIQALVLLLTIEGLRRWIVNASA